MRGLGWRAAAAAAAVLLAHGPGAGQTMPPALPQYAVLGVDAVAIRHDTRIAAGAVGAVGGTVMLGAGVRVSGAVAGPTVRLGRGTRVDRLFCDFVSGPSALPLCRAFTPPLVDPALLAPVVAAAGTDDVRIPSHTGRAPIAAGTYRDISVGAGGSLPLAGGVYAARSVRIGRRARIVCLAACHLTVVGDVVLRRRAELGAVMPQRADTVRVDVAGTAVAAAFTARAGARVSATVYAPDGAILLGPAGSYRGAYVGRTVTIGPGATVRVDSAL